MKRMIDAEKFLDKLLYMGYMDEQKSEVEEVANRMTEDAYTKDEVIAMLEDLKQDFIAEAYGIEMDCTDYVVNVADIDKAIQQKINTLEGVEDGKDN